MTSRRAVAYGSPVSAMRLRAAALILSCDIVPQTQWPIPAPGHRKRITMEGEAEPMRGLRRSRPQALRQGPGWRSQSRDPCAPGSRPRRNVAAHGEGGPQLIWHVTQGGVRQCACRVEDLAEEAPGGSRKDDVDNVGVRELEAAKLGDVLLGDLVGFLCHFPREPDDRGVSQIGRASCR